ncbi:hypothetical protein L2E82_00695 [Cichorium intybus]|uniref:Uncharacterized protein n=1 Tax=Cichorium intybus TaxID=13427 RepID=A0ACB9GYA1_CICIN|nr:hypothetical protein L2E82_00695 [Cichorium intybus]
MNAITKSLQQREVELMKKQQKLQKEKEKLEFKMRVRENLSSCKHLINVRKLAEGQKRELDMLHERRAELEAQLKAESFESLQMEIMQLETAFLQDDCIDPQEKMKSLKSKLIQINEQLVDLKDQGTTFQSAIQEKDDELQEARLELIDGLMTYHIGGGLGIKKMGLIDSAPFFAEKRKEKAVKFLSLCTHLVEDPDWHPFKTITVGSNQEEIIDEEDEKIVILKAECSEDQYRAVVTALMERNRYRQSGRDLMQELWNHKENREASLKEGINYILKEWKIHRQRRRR